MASAIKTLPLEKANSLLATQKARQDPVSLLLTLLGWRVIVGALLALGCVLPWYARLVAAALLLAAPLLRYALKACGVRPPAALAHPDDVPVIHTRFTAKPPKDGLCVFLIGARANAGLPFDMKELQWMGEAMSAMLQELVGSDPEVTGFLGVQSFHAAEFGSSHTFAVQYWRSQEHVVRYAQSQMNNHASAWRRLFALGKASPAIGFWHESYEVTSIDTIYSNMPLFGLSKALGAQPAVGSMMTSRNRSGKTKANDWPEENDLSKELF